MPGVENILLCLDVGYFADSDIGHGDFIEVEAVCIPQRLPTNTAFRMTSLFRTAKDKSMLIAKVRAISPSLLYTASQIKKPLRIIALQLHIWAVDRIVMSVYSDHTCV